MRKKQKKKEEQEKARRPVRERTCETSKSSRKRRREYWSALNLRLSAASVHRVERCERQHDFKRRSQRVRSCTTSKRSDMSGSRRSSSSPEVWAEIHTVNLAWHFLQYDLDRI